jgi:hypothetical protein
MEMLNDKFKFQNVRGSFCWILQTNSHVLQVNRQLMVNNESEELELERIQVFGSFPAFPSVSNQVRERRGEGERGRGRYKK